MASAYRTVAAVEAWKQRLITGREAVEIAGVASEDELVSAAKRAEAKLKRQPRGFETEVRAFPGSYRAGMQAASRREPQAVNRSQR